MVTNHVSKAGVAVLSGAAAGFAGVDGAGPEPTLGVDPKTPSGRSDQQEMGKHQHVLIFPIYMGNS